MARATKVPKAKTLAFRWKMCPDDAAKYGVNGWQEFRQEPYGRMPSSALERLEDGMNMSLVQAWALATQGRSRGVRAVMWLTLVTGGSDISWTDFDPLTLMMEGGVVEVDDVDPPDLSTDPSSSSEPVESSTS